MARNTKTASPKASQKASPKKAAGSTAQKSDETMLRELFVDELKDIYWAEKHLAKALPKMKKAATSPELAAAFDKHTGETETHIATLEKVFELLGEKAAAKKCDAMEGLIAEAQGVIEDTESGTMVRDAA